MKLNVLVVSLAVLLACSIGAQAQSITMKCDPEVPECGFNRMKITLLNATAGNGVTKNVHLWTTGDITVDQLTDDRGNCHIYVYPIPCKSSLSFTAFTDTLPEGKPLSIDIANGDWINDKTLVGSFSVNWGIAASENTTNDPPIDEMAGWIAKCAGVQGSATLEMDGDGHYQPSKGKATSSAVTSGSLDLSFSAGARNARNLSTTVAGGIAIAGGDKWTFVPKPNGHGHMPSKSCISCAGRITGNVSSHIGGSETQVSTATSVANTYVPAQSLKISRGSGEADIPGSPPVSVDITLPTKVVSDSPLSVPSAQTACGQCQVVIGDSFSYSGAACMVTSSERVVRTAYSVMLPDKKKGVGQ
jgi:hypothetical protein